MRIGNDFWKWFRFVEAVLKLLDQIFGESNGKEDVKQNGKVELD